MGKKHSKISKEEKHSSSQPKTKKSSPSPPVEKFNEGGYISSCTSYSKLLNPLKTNSNLFCIEEELLTLKKLIAANPQLEPKINHLVSSFKLIKRKCSLIETNLYYYLNLFDIVYYMVRKSDLKIIYKRVLY